MKKLLILLFAAIFFAACGGGGQDNSGEASKTGEATAKTGNGNPSYDPQRGEGKYKNVQVAANLDAALATNGEKVYGVKCGSCHKLSDEKLVGPGWKGVTNRRTADWILNFITNTDEMINKDPEVQAQLEICLVRMPNQNLSDDEAKSLYEFMRKNDGVK